MSYTAWSLVYGEQPSTAKWNILGTNDAHMYSFLGADLAWQSWTPTLANLTLGNGTRKAYYTRIGNTVFCRFLFLLGGTSAVGTTPTFTLPVNASADSGSVVGECALNDANSTDYVGTFSIISATTVQIDCYLASGTYAQRANITATVPFTWVSTDYMAGNFSYEAA